VNPSTIQPSHLNRLAIVYVLQSTPLQVEQHPEGRLRQYQLADCAGVRLAGAAMPGDRRRSRHLRLLLLLLCLNREGRRGRVNRRRLALS
jgi:hypothetical protein